MKNHFYRHGPPYAIMSLFILALLFLSGAVGNREEVHIYMDPENNVVCYITASDLECFTYTDEGTHLSLNR